ncbi:DUF4355 domain-containing protein [Cellulosilyticum sp. ST5]|uniref:DUF4355 domain-containing protein n=1 Tax=Cellulosilyticum sp. ST5 TaxID=3055805 RepID=UPI0039772FBD
MIIESATTKAIKVADKLNLRIPFDIQFFAEGGEGTGSIGTDPGTGEPGTGLEGGEGGEQTPSFDDLLKDKANQSEFDKRVAKALETAKSKWQTEQQKAIEDAKTEAEKLAKMNADQKAQYEKEKQEADFNKRLADLNTRELKATAKETLASEGLPLELAEVLNYADADTCNKSIEAVKTAFQSAVEKAVNEKLKGKGAPKAGDQGSDALSAQIAKAIRGQI